MPILAGREPRDPRSVDAPLRGPEAEIRRAALVTQLPGAPLPEPTHAAILRAGEALARAGWIVEEADPPELVRTCDVWGMLLSIDLEVLAPTMAPLLSPALAGHLQRMIARYAAHRMSNPRLHAERSRLTRAWSGFLSHHTVAVGPNWACPVWPIDADLDPEAGLARLLDTTRFSLPGNALGLPAVALPAGVRGGQPIGIQIYADLWREDRCLEAARIVEASAGIPTPIDPCVSPA